MNKELEQFYYKKILNERMKIRYMQLRSNITFYAMDMCVGNYEKLGLAENEIDCIKNRTKTYLTYYKEFNENQKNNLKEIYLNRIIE